MNFRPISVLSSVSKCFERILKGQIDRFFKPIQSTLWFQGGIQHTTFASKSYRSMEKEPRFIWYSWYDPYGPIKAYDCIVHDLLIAKLKAYGFTKTSLRLMHSYLTNRKQCVKIGCYKSSQSNIKTGSPKAPFLGRYYSTSS